MSNPFRVAVLASGSKGNATLISVCSRYFLIDLGISFRELKKRLSFLQLKPEDIEAVFITHEHSDHVRGLETWTKKTARPIYASAKTWAGIGRFAPELKANCCRVMQSPLQLGRIEITDFKISHDALDPHGYCFVCAGKKLVYVTDLGFISPTVKQALSGATTLVLESNHDVEMLENGSYPFLLKRRILSTKGHISNETAALTLASMPVLPQTVFLAHLSRQNNEPALALATMQKILADRFQKIKILVADQDNVVSDFEFQEVDLWEK